MKITMTELKCKRCGYSWFPKTRNIPKVCPKCKSAWWNIPRKKIKRKQNDK